MTQNINSNNKRIAKNTLLLYFRMLLTMCISIYTSRVVLEVLGVVDYGIYNVVGGFVTMFTVISGAMTTATQRFLSFEIGKGDDGDVTSLFSTSVMIHLCLAGIILLLAETAGLWFVNNKMNFPADRYYAANWVYQISVLTFMINVYSVPFNAAIIAYEKMSAFAYISILEVTLKLIMVYLLKLAKYDKLILYAVFLAVIAITIRIIYGIYCSRSFPLCRMNWRMDKTHRNNMLSFVSWNLIGSVAIILKEQGINVLLNMFFGAAINAARAVAYQVYNALHGFVNNFQLAMNPQIIKNYAVNDRKSMFDLVFRGSKFSFIIMLCVSLPIIIEAQYILEIWLKKVPNYSAIFLQIVLVTSLISSLSGTLITSMHASGKVRDYQIVVGGISLLTLPFAYLLLKKGFAPYYAMIASLIVETVCYFARMVMLRISIDFPVRRYMAEVSLKVLLLMLLTPILPILIFIIMPVDFLAFIAVTLCSVVSVLTISYIVALDKQERVLVNKKCLVLVHKFERK